MAKNHPLMKDVKKWIVDSFSFMDGIGYDVVFDDDIYGMENTKAISADIDGLTDFDFEKGKKNLLNSIPNKIKAEFPYLRIISGKDGDYFIMYIVLADNDDYFKTKNIPYVNLNESKESSRKSLKERDDTIFSKDVKRWMLSGNNINITFKDGNELVGAIYEHRKDSEDKKAECFLCEDLTSDYTGDYFIVEVYNGKISEIKFQSYDWLEHYMDDSYDLMESKKPSRKSLKENSILYVIKSRDGFQYIGKKIFDVCENIKDARKFKSEFEAEQFLNKHGKSLDFRYWKVIGVDSSVFKESRKSLKESAKPINESYEYEDIKNETPIIDVWGNSEGTHVYEVFKINSDYVYYEYNYRKHDSTMIVDNNEIEVIIRLMDYLPTKFIVKQEDKIGMLESAIANIKAINKHYGKLKKYNSNYYWQAVRFIKNSMLKDDDPDASNYFDEADDIINDAFEQNSDSFRV